jgi:hypothetical protein
MRARLPEVNNRTKKIAAALDARHGGAPGAAG